MPAHLFAISIKPPEVVLVRREGMSSALPSLTLFQTGRSPPSDQALCYHYRFILDPRSRHKPLFGLAKGSPMLFHKQRKALYLPPDFHILTTLYLAYINGSIKSSPEFQNLPSVYSNPSPLDNPTEIHHQQCLTLSPLRYFLTLLIRDPSTHLDTRQAKHITPTSDLVAKVGVAKLILSIRLGRKMDVPEVTTMQKTMDG